MPLAVAVDVGGTFTDFVYVDEGGELRSFKALTRPREPEGVVLEGLERVGPVGEVLHASTVATNALRGQIGLELPRVALLTTKGFGDIIEIGRQNRPKLYDPFFERPRPLVPKELRFEVGERVTAQGNVLLPLNEEELEQVKEQLRARGVEALAIGFLHSYANPRHELRAGEALRGAVKHITLSHDVAPEPREYERTSTAVVNAALMPLISGYLGRLRGALRSSALHIMSSSGGLVDPEEAAARPVQLIESGPAAGVVAAAELARMMNEGQAISLDMGGTTAKAGTIVEGEVQVTGEYEVGGEAHHGRLVKGSGYPVRFPFVDVAEVSAGGGTIIWRDEAGAQRVGPLSAGAEPGPACYGRGGAQPTITDANLALGRIGECLLGGELRLDVAAALRALSGLGEPLEVARSAIELINVEMARAIRLVTVERGLEPGRFSLIAFGGAGPQHAAELAQELGIRQVIIPPHPGAFSALGLLLADWRFEARASFPRALESAYAELEARLSSRLGRVDYFVRYADVRYEGQGWELTLPVPRPCSERQVQESFEQKHLATFGFTLKHRIEVVTIRVHGILRRPRPRLMPPSPKGEAVGGRRRCLAGGEWHLSTVYRREALKPGALYGGPALVEEYGSCTVVPGGWAFHVGPLGELRLRRA